MESKNDLLPEMVYEHLAKDVFNCQKAKDPWGYAYAEFYENNINKFKGKRALSTILIKIILDHKDSSLIDTLMNLENDVWNAHSQNQMNEIIFEARRIYDIIIHQS